MDAFKTLLAATEITTAVTGVVTPPLFLGMQRDAPRVLAVEGIFTYGSAGTTLKVWVQTSLDGGTTWIDIMCLAFTTASAKKVSAVRESIALAAATVPTDGALGDDSIVDGLLGDRIRLKYTSTGTYAGSTTIKVVAVTR